MGVIVSIVNLWNLVLNGLNWDLNRNWNICVEFHTSYLKLHNYPHFIR